VNKKRESSSKLEIKLLSAKKEDPVQLDLCRTPPRVSSRSLSATREASEPKVIEKEEDLVLYSKMSNSQLNMNLKKSIL